MRYKMRHSFKITPWLNKLIKHDYCPVRTSAVSAAEIDHLETKRFLAQFM